MNITQSSQSVEWQTPLALFRALRREFGYFNLDPAATDENHLCDEYYTEEMNGLIRPWISVMHGNPLVFCNPPYGRAGKTGKWLRKAWEEMQRYEELKLWQSIIVMIVPNHPGTKYWNDWVRGKAYEVRDMVGRVPFIGKTKDGQERGATFDSAIVIYRACPPWVKREGTIHTSMAWSDIALKEK